MDPFLIAGICVLTAVFLRLIYKWHRAEAKRKAEQQAIAQKTREAERRRQAQLGEEAKARQAAASRNLAERVPRPEPYDATFAGGPTPQNIARWEAEIHQIGREMIGRIDSKMVALQTLTLEANRAANRLEILVEHLERYSKLSTKLTGTQEIKETAAVSAPMESSPEAFAAMKLDPPGEDPFAEFYVEHFRENAAEEEETETAQAALSAEPAKSNLIPAEQSVKLNPVAAVLDELQAQADSLFESQAALTTLTAPAPATVLRPEVPTSESTETLRAEPVELSRRLPESFGLTGGRPSSPGPVRKKLSRGQEHPLSLGSPVLPGGTGLGLGSTAIPPSSVVNNTSRRITVSPDRRDVEAPLPLDALYDDKLTDREGGELFAVAGVSAESRSVGAEVSTTAAPPREIGSHLELRRQVELMSDYGYTPRQIAQSLDLTVGEVDLMLNLRR